MNGSISFSDVIEYQTALKMRVEELEKENRRLTETMIENTIPIDKFPEKSFTIEQVAYLHGVHENTVRNYIKDKLIPLSKDSTDRAKKIDAEFVLKMDFRELKKLLKLRS